MMLRRVAAMAGGGFDVEPGSDAESDIFEDLAETEGLRESHARAARMWPYIQ